MGFESERAYSAHFCQWYVRYSAMNGSPVGTVQVPVVPSLYVMRASNAKVSLRGSGANTLQSWSSPSPSRTGSTTVLSFRWMYEPGRFATRIASSAKISPPPVTPCPDGLDLQ